MGTRTECEGVIGVNGERTDKGNSMGQGLREQGRFKYEGNDGNKIGIRAHLEWEIEKYKPREDNAAKLRRIQMEEC